MYADLPPSAETVPLRRDGWSGVALIAITYIYFLIFAQFGFLKRLDQLGLGGAHLKLVMAVMAIGGIAASLTAARVFSEARSLRMIRGALVGCASAAFGSMLPLGAITAALVAVLIGVSLGLLTVTLVSSLRLWLGAKSVLIKVGLGTGVGYFVCNIPALFTAAPVVVAGTSAALCIIAAFLRPPLMQPAEPTIGKEDDRRPSFILLLIWFTALIWFDSAAFYIIQNSPALKSGTWQGTAHLWRNAALHLAAALLSGWLLTRRMLYTTMFGAMACLGLACLLLQRPGDLIQASLLYPIGVSLYSVALVAAPSFLLRTSSADERARRAGWIYALAGWIGSAAGIGMAQNLHHVPRAFIAGALAVFAIPLLLRACPTRMIQVGIVLVSLGMAELLHVTLLRTKHSSQADATLSEIAAGRRVYIAEGCINCHSQYIRPNSADVTMWGPTQDLEAIRHEKPPLIGNRRQGPDLSEVGARRSTLWLKIHTANPRDLSYDSIMPSFGFLFEDRRGENLVAYLHSLQTPGSRAHIERKISSWTPAAPLPSHSIGSGRSLFDHYCATCHEPTGAVRKKWSASFVRLPPDLATDQLPDLDGSTSQAQLRRLAATIKFGIPGTDMPGHEYLPDDQIATLATYVQSLRTNHRPTPAP